MSALYDEFGDIINRVKEDVENINWSNIADRVFPGIKKAIIATLVLISLAFLILLALLITIIVLVLQDRKE